MLEAVHECGGVSYSALEHLYRGRWKIESGRSKSFDDHYRRAVPERVMTWARALGAEEAQVLTPDDVLVA